MSSKFRSVAACSRDFGGDHVNDVEEDNDGYSTEDNDGYSMAEVDDDDFHEEGDDVDENVGEGDDVHKKVGAGDEVFVNLGDMLGNTMARNPMVVDDMVVGDDEFNEGNLGVEELKVGALFRNIRVIRNMAREYAIEHQFVYVPIETTPYKYDLRCKDRSCPWRLTGTTYLDYVKVKWFIPDHTCSNPLKGNDHPLVTTSWAAETCLGLFPSLGDIKPSLIREFIKDRWGITISYRKAHMAKVIIHEIKCGNAEASYRILPAYAHEMTLVLVDGTHLRGKYRGILLAATGIDGNGGLFLLAFAVAEGESYESWLWFLLLFRHTMMSAERNVITIASNRMKGLPRAVAEALPSSYHSYCIRHMSANFYSTFKSQVLRRQFMRAAYALRESVFKDAMEIIKEMNIEAYKWIEEVPKENWASVYFPGFRYNVLTTNVAKCFNAILKEARELQITSLVDHIRWKVSDFFQSR
ncbi:uncharacterized protein LOC143885954 [Tasmannia lanceolata]|uniref:uncharacterized protein LOC143885954 n=1 Tax=Tasmannia lanceolata TaxID=3420 RepID=UPI0040637807